MADSRRSPVPKESGNCCTNSQFLAVWAESQASCPSVGTGPFKSPLDLKSMRINNGGRILVTICERNTRAIRAKCVSIAFLITHLTIENFVTIAYPKELSTSNNKSLIRTQRNTIVIFENRKSL